MRCFSNIMSNFAPRLHLLVDSIPQLRYPFSIQIIPETFGVTGIIIYLCSMNVHSLNENPRGEGVFRIAILDPNTLAVLGLKSLIQQVMPVVAVDTFGEFAEMEANNPDDYVHYFVAMNTVLQHRDFFLQHRRKTIVLTLTTSTQMSDFRCLCINVPEKQLVRSLLVMQQGGHPGGKNLPPLPEVLQRKILTDRELEVLSLIVQGNINKEIADQLNIGLTTVITHRKNIMDKLGLKSVSALTIYAIMHGYVDINKI